jgi:hypothetical protein
MLVQKGATVRPRREARNQPGACEEESMNLENPEKRSLDDRRTKPTPGLSRFTLFGRRQKIRRKDDLSKGVYVDRYSSTLFFLLVSTMALNVLDTLLTMTILDKKGYEANPIVRAVIELHGDKFWIWKFVMVSVCLVLLCLHSRFKVVRIGLIFLMSIYFVTVIYQVLLLSYR